MVGVGISNELSPSLASPPHPPPPPHPANSLPRSQAPILDENYHIMYDDNHNIPAGKLYLCFLFRLSLLSFFSFLSASKASLFKNTISGRWLCVCVCVWVLIAENPHEYASMLFSSINLSCVYERGSENYRVYKHSTTFFFFIPRMKTTTQSISVT